MQIRCILQALVLGGVMTSYPALGRDDARGNWAHHASQSTTSRRNSNSGNQQGFKQQSIMPSNRNFAPRIAPPNSQPPQRAQNNFHQNWNRDFSTSHTPNDNRSAGRNFNRNSWNNPAHTSWNANRDRNGIRDWNGNRRNNDGLNRGARHRPELNNFRFSSRDVSRFNSSERNRWTHGRWHHGRHHHRFGWWWFANGGWFFYDQPIYPYPGYVSSDAYYEDYSDEDDYSYDGDSNDNYGDDSGGTPANDGYWYYCRDPEGYYPDIRQCNTDWQRVSPSSDGQDYNNNNDSGPDEGGSPYDNGSENDRR